MILFFGPPGSGKSSQGRLMAEREGWLWLSTGELFRKSGDPEIQERLSSGELIDDTLTNRVVEKTIAELAHGAQVILDGYPRNLSQVKWLASRLRAHGLGVDGVVLFDLPRDEIIRRLTDRGRMEDSAEVIDHRLAIYREQTFPVVGYYRDHGIPVARVNAVGTVQEVHERIRLAIRQCQKQQ